MLLVINDLPVGTFVADVEVAPPLLQRDGIPRLLVHPGAKRVHLVRLDDKFDGQRGPTRLDSQGFVEGRGRNPA